MICYVGNWRPCLGYILTCACLGGGTSCVCMFLMTLVCGWQCECIVVSVRDGVMMSGWQRRPHDCGCRRHRAGRTAAGLPGRPPWRGRPRPHQPLIALSNFSKCTYRSTNARPAARRQDHPACCERSELLCKRSRHTAHPSTLSQLASLGPPAAAPAAALAAARRLPAACGDAAAPRRGPIIRIRPYSTRSNTLEIVLIRNCLKPSDPRACGRRPVRRVRLHIYIRELVTTRVLPAA